MDVYDKIGAGGWLVIQAIGAGITAAAAITYGVWWLAVAMIVAGTISLVFGVRDILRAVREVQAPTDRRR